MENEENTQEVELDETKNSETVDSQDNIDETTDTEDSVDWKAEALKQKAINKRLNQRIQKPEVKEVSQKDSPLGSPKDLYALSQASVHIDDVDEVLEYAKFKKISVQDALKSDVIKTVLANKAEFRKTAEVTSTKTTQRSVAKVTDDVLESNLRKGVVPEKGSEEAERLFYARRGGKR